MPRIELNTEELQAEKESLGEFLAQPTAYTDPDFTKNNKRFTELEGIIAKATELKIIERQLTEAKQLAGGSDE
ncbi:MAG TPA: peptide chain release factor 1, partial [Candidatus Saccharimonadales bacterium]|nr:peptide chain release factor 1 [Candidatus Saccharimonadales bacterium]